MSANSYSALLAAALLLLGGCRTDERAELAKADQAAPLRNVKGLEDCTYIKVDMSVRWLHVIRCPNSSTTTQWQNGKQTATATTVSR